MNIALIAAMGKSNIIGSNNKLPWHLPADLKYFKKITFGKPIIMGRNTFESIGRVLPGRQNIVVTKNKAYKINFTVTENTQLTLAHDLQDALNSVKGSPEEIMIIGGATLFKEALPIATKLYLTYIHADFSGDTFFPAINQHLWKEVWREDHAADSENPYPYSFVCLERKNPLKL